MKLNGVGEIVYKCWNKINDIYDNVRVDALSVNI
jgi:hypothetical protein